MTERSESERAELVALEAELRRATYGKDGPTSPKILGLMVAAADAIRRLAAQDQKPVAWIDFADNGNVRLWTSEKHRATAELASGRKMSAVYLSPPPAAGWDEAIEACKKVAEKWLESFMGGEAYVARSIVNAIEALRHNAPLDSGAGESEPPHWREVEMMRLIDLLRSKEGDSVTILCDNPDFDFVCNGGWTNWQDLRFAQDTLLDALSAAMIEYKRPRDPAVLPDHGGADAGVKLVRNLQSYLRVLRSSRERNIALEVWKSDIDLIERSVAALSKPAPVAANASAELSKFANDLAAKQEPLGVQISAEDLESIYIRSEPSANASAEARLREALEEWLDAEIETASEHQRRAFSQCRDRDGDRHYSRNCALQAVKQKIKALSTHPHASDYDKQGEQK